MGRGVTRVFGGTSRCAQWKFASVNEKTEKIIHFHGFMSKNSSITGLEFIRSYSPPSDSWRQYVKCLSAAVSSFLAFEIFLPMHSQTNYHSACDDPLVFVLFSLRVDSAMRQQQRLEYAGARLIVVQNWAELNGIQLSSVEKKSGRTYVVNFIVFLFLPSFTLLSSSTIDLSGYAFSFVQNSAIYSGQRK